MALGSHHQYKCNYSLNEKPMQSVFHTSWPSIAHVKLVLCQNKIENIPKEQV